MKTTGKLLVLAAIVVLSGCDSAKQTYDQLRLGEEIPAKLPPEAGSGSMGVCVLQSDVSIAPLAMSLSQCRGARSESGVVVAKMYTQVQAGHHGVVVVARSRYLLEVEVPPEQFLDGPVDESRQDPELNLHRLLLGLIAVPTTQPTTGSAPTGLTFESDIRELTRVRTVKVATTSPVTGKKEPTTRQGRVFAPPMNVAEYLQLADVVLRRMKYAPARPSKDDGLAMIFGVFGGMAGIQSMDIAEYSQAFAGITKPGWDWRKTKNNATYRVRNLGGRRVRVEIQWRVVDAPAIPMMDLTFSKPKPALLQEPPAPSEQNLISTEEFDDMEPLPETQPTSGPATQPATTQDAD